MSKDYMVSYDELDDILEVGELKNKKDANCIFSILLAYGIM